MRHPSVEVSEARLDLSGVDPMVGGRPPVSCLRDLHHDDLLTQGRHFDAQLVHLTGEEPRNAEQDGGGNASFRDLLEDLLLGFRIDSSSSGGSRPSSSMRY